MTFADYSRFIAPQAFRPYADALARRDSIIATLTVQPSEVPALLATHVAARRNAVSAPGRFPVVLMVAGLNAESTSQAVLAELLASRGYIVATVPWDGVDENQIDAVGDAVGLEAVIRDLEFAWGRLRTERSVSPTEVAAVGHSLGGVIAVAEGMRNGDVAAVIGLDATYGFQGATNVLTGFYSYAPQKMTASMLDLRKAAGEQGTVLDLQALQLWYHSDRSFITLRHIRHSEFTSYSLISDVFHEPPIPPQFQTAGWTRTTAARGYVAACRMVADFLDARLRGDSTASQHLVSAVSDAPGAAVSYARAIPPAPSAPELVAIATARGFDSAAAVVERYRKDAPTEVVVDPGAMNNLGYQFLGEHRVPEALTAFRLVIHVNPASANAYDSYGDGLVAAADTTGAITAYRRALELAPRDSSLNASGRDDLMKSDREHLRVLSHLP
ncbi:MAG TPA: alpha/beta hydrolase [Gemmatimonadales bacterium]|jgi:hypothetical protein